MGARKYLSVEQKCWLCGNFSCMGDKEIAEKLGLSVSAVRYHAYINNLHKSLAYIKKVRRRGADVTNSKRRRNGL